MPKLREEFGSMHLTKFLQELPLSRIAQIDLFSPKGHDDSSDTVRAKLRESLASVVAMVWDGQPKKDVKMDNNFQIEATALNMHRSADYKVVDTELNAMTDKYCQGQSFKKLCNEKGKTSSSFRVLEECRSIDLQKGE
jgi:hypothetical protein